MDYLKLTDMEFAKVFQAIQNKILEDPIAYFVEAPALIDFTPTPAQRVALKIIFGQELDPHSVCLVRKETTTTEGAFDLKDIETTEPELYRYMTGFEYVPGDKAQNQINLIIGRRGGKSVTSAIIAIFSMLKINWKPFLTKIPVATVLILSHTVEFSEEIIDILKTLVDESPILSRLKDPKRKNTTKIFHLKVPFLIKNSKGKEVIQWSRVRAKAGAASKKSTRGSAVCTVLTDEIAWWNSAEKAVESDEEIMRAVRPALLQFKPHGTIIKLSSPSIKQGVLYEEWVRKAELKKIIVQFKAPSWVWNTILPIDAFKDEHQLDPDGFNTEFRAEFVDSISNFILPEFVDMAVIKNVAFQPPSEDTRTVYSAAIDAAFKNDNFAFSLVGFNENRVSQYIAKHWTGTRKNPVKANEVAKYIRTICAQYGINTVTGDQYSFQPLREIFETYGVTLVENTFSLPYKRKIYFGLKRLIHNQQMDLLDDSLQTKELKELQVEQTPSGQISIGHPPGGSDDKADALAVATFVSLETAGSQGMSLSEIASGATSGVIVDKTGRAFSAPHPEMLGDYKGYKGVIDNTAEYAKDPETGKWRKRSELEEETELATNNGPDFSF